MKLSRSEQVKMRSLQIGLGIFIIAVGILLHPLTSRYLQSPAAVRYPTTDHYHFRTQLFVDGQAVDFSQPAFQETYEAGQCSALLSDTPIHFHDNVDQMTHVHWDGMTGGIFLKYYGWNFIGGNDDTIGWRFDENWQQPKRLAINGDKLPELPTNSDFYVYITTDDGYEQKNWDEFLNQDLETFFDKESNLNSQADLLTLQDWLFPKASAHGGVADEHSEGDGDLKSLNNLIGDVAIFVQGQQPSDEEVQAAFSNLIDLPESTCGG